MSMTTESGQVAAHMCADLACQFARRHAASGRHDKAAGQFDDAARLYGECGCGELAELATGWAEAERDIHILTAMGR